MLINQIKELLQNQHAKTENEEFQYKATQNVEERQRINKLRFEKCFSRLRYLNSDDKKNLPEVIQNLIPKESEENHSKAINVFCQLSNDESYGNALEEALLIDQYYRDRQVLEQRNQKQKQKHRGHSQQPNKQYGKQDLEEFLRKYQMNQLRLKNKVIGSLGKSTIKHNYFQNEEQLARSQERKQRIMSVTEKLNKNRINIVQNFFKKDLTIRRQQYCDVIDFLATYNDKNVPQKLQNFIIHRNIDEIKKIDIQNLLKKIFFQYSNKNDPDLSQIFQYVTLDRFYDLFMDLNLNIEVFLLKKTFDSIVRNPTNQNIQIGMNFKQFVEGIVQIAMFYVDDKQFSFNDEEFTHNNPKTSKLRLFVENKLHPNRQIFLQPSDYQLQQCQYYQEFNNKLEILLKPLFLLDLNYNNLNQVFLKLDDLIRLFMKIKLFPKHITKSIIRYFFHYNLRQDDGLSFSDFQQLINMLALEQSQKLLISKESFALINQYIAPFEQKENINERTLQTYRKILIFCIHQDYLNANSY